MKINNYAKIGLILGTSYIITYTVMYLNVAQSSHVYLNLTRAYMVLMMVSPMALMLLFFMPKMFRNKRLNGFVFFACIAVFGLSLDALRTQTAIGDGQYMKAMITHNSSAILTSRNANIKNPEVKKLSDKIIQSRKEEISQMENILDQMEK